MQRKAYIGTMPVFKEVVQNNANCAFWLQVWDTDHGKERTKQSFSNSLKRLDLDYVDLYLMHSAIGGKTVETWDAMIELKEKGLIRSIGVSNFNAHHLRELKKARPNYLPAGQ